MRSGNAASAAFRSRLARVPIDAEGHVTTAISARNVYTFAVSTHYPSQTVRADDGGPVYYQDQVLGIVPRSTFGSGY